MNERSALPVSKHAPSPVAACSLQRQCACGTHTPGGGECSSCRAKRQRTSGSAAIAAQSALPARFGAGPGVDLSGVPVTASAMLRHGGGADDAVTAIEPDVPATPDRSSADADAGKQAPDAAAPADATAADAGVAPATPQPALEWTQQLRHTYDALWYFAGEHPAGFSIDTHLRASGFSDATQLHWRIVTGADKVAFHGPATGAEVVLDSKEGSRRLNDVTVEVSEGTGPSAVTHAGQLTVRKPHHLVHENRVAHAACPPWGGCTAGCAAWWVEFTYRIKDNVGGTIVGATVNENFPGAKTDDQPNNWASPAAFATVPFWPQTNGTFVDNWFISCGTPTPLAPGTPNAGQSVDRMAHEFYIGSQVPGRGVRVQRHLAHRYRAFAEHENVVTPAP